MSLFENTLILVKGAGDLGTGVAWRLRRAGFPVIVTELAQPLVVRRTVAFASSVYDDSITVEGVTARLARTPAEARRWLGERFVPVLIDPEMHTREIFHPVVLVDAVLAKRNTGTHLDDALFVIALGPGFTPRVDCHAVIETNRGHNLGRVLWHHPAEPNTGAPGEIGGKSGERVLRAPMNGIVQSVKMIGDQVTTGEIIARVGEDVVRAPFDGILRGLVHDGLAVRAGMKIGDVDPRAERAHCFSISDKALAVGGGVLEAVLVWLNGKDE